MFLSLTLAACSGSSGGNRTPDNTPPVDPPPSLSLSASPTTVAQGGSATLSWNASDASSCDASGGWSGARAVSGSEPVGPINSDTVFRLSCSGAGGGVSREVTVRVDSGDVSVDLSASPQQVGENDSATLTWSSQGASSCSASGGWSGSQPLSGSASTGPLQSTTTFSLSCSNGSDNSLASVTVEVLDKTIRWQAPTENEDGTPITDLGGFNIYWGEQSGNYTGSYTINSPTTTEWEADIAPGTYYFAMTAFDVQGNESDYSNELLKVIP